MKSPLSPLLAATVPVSVGIGPLDGPEIPRTAAVFARLATAKGFELDVAVLEDGAYSIEGIHRERGLGFRCEWVEGRAKGGTWHERATRYGLVPDNRPENDATIERRVKGKVKRVPDPRRKPAGIGTERLAYLAGPHGVPCTITTITNNLKALG